MPFCMACRTVEIKEGLICGLCAPVFKKQRAREAREARKPTYNEYVRAVPLRPVTLPPLRFGGKDEA